MRIKSHQHLWKTLKTCKHVVRAQIPPHMLERQKTVAFRGDTRHPNQIFSTGLKARSPGDAPIIRFHPSMLHTNWESAICLSGYFVGATYFPDTSTDTYIYVIDNQQTFNTGKLIARIIANSSDFATNIRTPLYLRDLAFQELTTTDIPTNNILMAIELAERKLEQSSIDWQVSFQIKDYVLNSKAKGKKNTNTCSRIIKEYPPGNYQFTTRAIDKKAQEWLNKYSPEKPTLSSQNALNHPTSFNRFSVHSVSLRNPVPSTPV